MRRCPTCGTEYPDETTRCPADGDLPKPVTEAATPAPPPPAAGLKPGLLIGAFVAAAGVALLLATLLGKTEVQVPPPQPSLPIPAPPPKPGRVRLGVDGIEIRGALVEEAARAAIHGSLPALAPCAAEGLAAPVPLELSVSPAGVVTGVTGDVGSDPSVDATVVCASQGLIGLSVGAPTDGHAARIRLTLQPTE